MSESRSRLERVVEERLRERFLVRVKAKAPTGMPASRQLVESGWREEFLPMSAAQCAEVAVGAVLDELSEGPLHDAMVKVACHEYARLVDGPGPKLRKSLHAALSGARTWNEE